jgi:hypothetical protein
MSRAKNRMGCGCELGCGCEIGAGCDMGCACGQKLGQRNEKRGINPLWFALGAGAGVGLWYLLKDLGRKPDSTVDTIAAPMPPLTPPSRYGNLQAIAVRLDQLKTLYRSGQVSSEQAIAEIDSLISAAYGFSSEEGERVNEVVGPLMDFKAQIEDFIQFQKSLEPIPAASSIRRGGTAYA